MGRHKGWVKDRKNPVSGVTDRQKIPEPVYRIVEPSSRGKQALMPLLSIKYYGQNTYVRIGAYIRQRVRYAGKW
jgi:hypothetical protein